MEKYFLSVILFLFATSMHMAHSVLIKKIGIGGFFSTYEIIFLRSFITFCILMPFFATKKIKFIERQNLLSNFIVAICAIIGTYCWHYGLSMVPINNAVTINFLIPMTISMLAMFLLKERISKTLIISITICFATIVCFYKPKAILQFGYLLLLIDVFSYSLSIVLSKKLMLKKQSPVSIVFFKVSIICITSVHIIPSLLPKIQQNPNVLFSCFIVTLLYICETLLFLTAYNFTKVSKLQPLYYTRIVFGILISYLILGEYLKTEQLIVAIIITLVNLNLIRYNKKQKEQKSLAHNK